MKSDDLPVVDPDNRRTEMESATVWGVLLASGTSSRFGNANKLAACIDGDPLVRQAARSLTTSDVDGTTVVIGYQANVVRDAIGSVDVEFRVNDEYERGQSTSVREGVVAAKERGADAVLIALGDMPSVSPESCNRLIEAYLRNAGSVLAAGYRGTRGNPVLFDAKHFEELLDVDGDVGGREILLSASDGAIVETDDPGVLADVDTLEDLDDL